MPHGRLGESDPGLLLTSGGGLRADAAARIVSDGSPTIQRGALLRRQHVPDVSHDHCPQGREVLRSQASYSARVPSWRRTGRRSAFLAREQPMLHLQLVFVVDRAQLGELARAELHVAEELGSS
jgi:hypothetical protein